MNRTRTLTACLLTAVFAVGLVAGRVAAAPSDIDAGYAAPPSMDSIEVVDPQAMAEIVAITERIDPLLVLDADGLVQLPAEVSAEQLGVSQEFLDNYRLALGFSNRLIETGQITVDADMKVSANESFVGSVELPGPGGPGAGQMSGAETDGAPQGATPDWYTWRYSGGAMYYNSYQTYNTYGRTGQYYGLCNSMAAQLGYPWMSSSLVNFYTYNNSYLNRYCYNNYGSYYYLPYYNTGCGSYNPCYGGTSYKPAYFWGQARTYNYSCRCYSYNWQWYGTWCRY
ncbi:MAG: hypothetical protein H6648_06365 [Caldilineae bacterium]|nr:hypothetical protein [Caldilineae bacterium]